MVSVVCSVYKCVPTLTLTGWLDSSSAKNLANDLIFWQTTHICNKVIIITGVVVVHNIKCTITCVFVETIPTRISYQQQHRENVTLIARFFNIFTLERDNK